MKKHSFWNKEPFLRYGYKPIVMQSGLINDKRLRKTNNDRLFRIIIMFILVFNLFGFEFCLFGQMDKKADSLLSLASRSDGENRANIYGDLGEYLMDSSPEKAYEYGKTAMEYSEKIKYPYGKARGLIVMGITCTYLGKYDESVQYLNEGLKIIKEIKQYSKVPLVLMNIGITYYRQGKYDEAFYYFLNSAALHEERKDTISYAKVLGNMAFVYEERKEYDKALDYLLRSKNIFKKAGKLTEYSQALNNLGTVYNTLNRWDDALSVYTEALEVKAKYDAPVDEFITLYNNIAIIQDNKGNSNKALEYYYKALALSKKSSNMYSTCAIYCNMGELYQQKKNYELSLAYYDSCYSIAKDIKSLAMLAHCYSGYSELYQSMGDYKNALSFLKKFNDVNDSLFTEKSSKRIEELQIKYESEKSKKELAVKGLEIRKKKSQNLILIISLSFVFLTLIFIVYLYFYTRKKKTILERMNIRLSESESSLKASNDTKEKLFGIVTHDLKNPFGTLISLTSFLEESYREIDENHRLTAIQTIRKSAVNAFELLETLTKWSIAQSRKIQTDKKVIDILELVRTTLLLLKIEAENKNILVNLIIPPDTYAYADETMIKTVMRNLVGNAIKFTPENGDITISANVTDADVVISIHDSGIGIPENDKSKIFRVDIKHSTPGTAKERGTGLGLILAKELVEKNDGKIWFESEYQKGSTFYFSLSKAA